jgi:hypothetical protein
MKKRYLYALLFGIPGFFVAGMIALFVFGAVMGGLWLFVFGDNTWPFSMDILLPVLRVVVFLLLWVGFITLGFVIGKRFEKDTTWHWKHVLVSGAVTLLFILFIILQQWSVGNLGPKSDSALCSDYCTRQGYSASGLPPLNSGDRSCSCYDNAGDEALKVPLDKINPGASK